ncbi:hypothetical protein H257_02654 [Aphanomyces astaci]|uniref:GED domain-containing protein n=1 Tax=Aphanomyces astaci TaxID=112090 RepID=W4H2I2_APHAT|nr:hypothetical protein H257_02654 [Aphanomyces astaci]ETV86225.1 hypothetical protein H257_02654 [Aphanomyces astaci]|eukprot:XP_009824697.1 hypothetical protein H257_02654 [Aphanomyces astaci]
MCVQMLEANRGDELSIFLSYSTFANVVRQRYVTKWRPPMLKLFEAYQNLMLEFVNRAIESKKSKRSLEGNHDAARVSMGAVKALLKNHAGIGASTNEDQQAKELHLAIIAYMKVASKRFVDVIPMLLQTNFTQPILLAVFNETAETSDGVLDRVLMDNIADVERYQNVSNQLKSLEAAKNIINAY